MFCVRCGSELSENARFCTNCGQAVEGFDASQAPFAANVSKGGAARPAQPGMNPASIAAIVAAAVAVVVVIVVIVLVVNPFGSGDASQRSSAAAANAASSAASASASAAVSSSASSATTTIGQQPAASSSAAPSGDYVLPDSSTRYYSRSEFEAMDLHDLYLARNEIYARYGRGFKKDDLQSYFNSKSWYTQRYTPDQFEAMPSPLNDYERANAELMLEVEKSRNSPYV